MPEDDDSELRKPPVLRILAAALVVIVVVGGAVWYIRKPKPPSPTVNTNQSTNAVAPVPRIDARQGSAPEDADQDGLINSEEEKLGTNPTLNDTDRDGLSDFDEAKLYQTDPKNPDTDSDGFPDGEEVNKKFNPKGDGQLFETIPPPSTPTNQ